MSFLKIIPEPKFIREGRSKVFEACLFRVRSDWAIVHGRFSNETHWAKTRKSGHLVIRSQRKRSCHGHNFWFPRTAAKCADFTVLPFSMVLADVALPLPIPRPVRWRTRHTFSWDILKPSALYVKKSVENLLVLKRLWVPDYPHCLISMLRFKKVTFISCKLRVSALRMRPPVPTGLQRVAPNGGASINGQQIPQRAMPLLTKTYARRSSAPHFTYCKTIPIISACLRNSSQRDGLILCPFDLL
jgi:hypothetical protein